MPPWSFQPRVCMGKIRWVRNRSRYCDLPLRTYSELRYWFPQAQEAAATYDWPLSPSLGIVFSQRESPRPKLCPSLGWVLYLMSEQSGDTQAQPPCIDSGLLCRAIPVQFPVRLRLQLQILGSSTSLFSHSFLPHSLTDVELESTSC